MIALCRNPRCRHTGQDALHGQQRRVFNACSTKKCPASSSSKVMARCTVCLELQELPIEQLVVASK